MSDEILSIRPAELAYIERCLRVLSSEVDSVNSNVNEVNLRVNKVDDELAALTRGFGQFIMETRRQHNHAVAETRLVQVRQQLETKFGHYKKVRETTTGILQANDLSIVRKQTITFATEELMLATPNYWLTPCLITLAAWISNDKELAERALLEGINRNDEKTSLLFALICRRMNREDASLKWIERYLSMQDPETIDRKCMIIIDAYASGVLATDSEGKVARKINSWLEELSKKPGFEKAQTRQWHDAILLQKKSADLSEYTYLQNYSDTWAELQEVMDGAFLHDDLSDYFESIFKRVPDKSTLPQQIDSILFNLVADYDDEELPLRREERENELIVRFKGDIDRAKQDMQIEQSAFAEQKSFTQLLTDAAMKPELSHSSAAAQQFAIALSRDWILEAYNDIIAENRANIPEEIEISIENFNDVTEDGSNEEELTSKMNQIINREKANALNQVKLNVFDYFCLVGGIGAAGYGVVNNLQMLFILIGTGLVFFYWSRSKKSEQMRNEISTNFERKREKSLAVLRGTLAEVVDFRTAFQSKDAEAQKVIDYLKQLSPEQYIKKIDTSRKVRLAESNGGGDR